MGGANIFKVLADGQRREILMMLKDGRLNAGEISEKKNNVVFCNDSSGRYRYCVTVYARRNTYAS